MSNQNQTPESGLHQMLSDSTTRFLTEYRNGVIDFSNITSIFSRFCHVSPDPPLELTWFHSALTFHSAKLSCTPPLALAVTKELFQLLVSFSSSLDPEKSIALLAPVVFDLFHLVVGGNVCGNEVDSLLEGVVSFVSITCGGAGDGQFGGLVSGLVDLVRVWTVDRVGESGKVGEVLKVFFPVLSDGVRSGLLGRDGFRGGVGVGELAGIVMCEVLLLRLCLKFRAGVPRADLESELYDLAGQMVMGFRSYYFLDTLLRMLFEPVLPVTLLLNSRDEALLREVLSRIVIAADYSFLSPHKGIQLPSEQLKNFVLMWLFVADNVMRFVREHGEQTKVISYVRAFHKSSLPSELIKWVMDQPSMQGKTNLPNVHVPSDLIRWLLIVDDLGVRIFARDMLKVYAKAIILKSRNDHDLFVVESDSSNLIENHWCHAPNCEEMEDKSHDYTVMIDSVYSILSESPGFLKLTPATGARKRKEGITHDGDKQVKFVKCHPNDGLIWKKASLPMDNDGGSSRGSDVDNQFSIGSIMCMEE